MQIYTAQKTTITKIEAMLILCKLFSLIQRICSTKLMICQLKSGNFDVQNDIICVMSAFLYEVTCKLPWCVTFIWQRGCEAGIYGNCRKESKIFAVLTSKIKNFDFLLREKEAERHKSAVCL